MKFVIALFGAPRDINTKLALELQAAFSKPECSVHELEGPVKDIARRLFGLPAEVVVRHPEKWSDPEVLYYGKTIEQLFKAAYKFATILDPGVLVDRILDEAKSMPPTCPYCIVRDGRTLKEWEILQAKNGKDFLIIGVLIKRSEKSPFDASEFDVAVSLSDVEQDFAEAVKAIVDWTHEVHGAAEPP